MYEYKQVSVRFWQEVAPFWGIGACSRMVA